jgi:hypothetical protein
MGKQVFHENWYSDEQLAFLIEAYELVPEEEGTLLEIGCWEGRSTVAIARACQPDTLFAIDTWLGNQDEHPEHISVQLSRQRDVFATFLQNVQSLTDGNVVPVRQDCHVFLRALVRPVKFCHIDACHDYLSVKRTIDTLLPRLIHGAVLCGDDFVNANASRDELQGGVERAVRECLPGYVAKGNFWVWQKT